ncbi:MAG: heavy metal translocating P-type ATPase, partial [Candidatus Limnocylindria bacterium]
MDHSAHQHHDQHQPPDRGARQAAAVEHGAHASHDKHAGHDPDVFRRQFWIVLALTIPVVIWSEEVQMWLGYTAPVFPGSEWIPAILGTIVFGYGGWVFLKG